MLAIKIIIKMSLLCLGKIFKQKKIQDQVSCGDYHTAFLTKGGNVYTCGWDGKLGTGDQENRSVPTKIEFLQKCE